MVNNPLLNYNACTYTLCGGQGRFETTSVQSVSSDGQSWGLAFSYFPYSSIPWGYRLGFVGMSGGFGLFYAYYLFGSAFSDYGFRSAQSF
jgi:hypothetical protein